MTDSSATIDWQRLAEDLRALEHKSDGGRIELGSTELTRRAIERLLTPARVRQSVDHYVAGAPGFELARSVLWLLRPWSAMERCREIYLSSMNIQERRSAVELLRVVSDARVVPWISEFLADVDEAIQSWGIGVLDQLVSSELVSLAQCTALLEEGQAHRNPQVRERAIEIASRLASTPVSESSASSSGESA